MAHTIPVWSFPAGYDPNEWQERCERCFRLNRWISQPIPDQPEARAWICSACTQWPPPFRPTPAQRNQIPE